MSSYRLTHLGWSTEYEGSWLEEDQMVRYIDLPINKGSVIASPVMSKVWGVVPVEKTYVKKTYGAATIDPSRLEDPDLGRQVETLQKMNQVLRDQLAEAQRFTVTLKKEDPYQKNCQQCANLKETNHMQYVEHMRLISEMTWFENELRRYNPALVKAHEASIKREMDAKRKL
jgi:hypothetical protein